MVRVLSAGHVNWDVTLRLDELPEPDGEARINSQSSGGGGSAANTAVALSSLGVDVAAGEPPESFCPGSHSLQAPGKLAGVAQRVRADAALVSGVVIVTDRKEIADVLTPVYDALGVPFDPKSVGSVAHAGGPDDPDPVVRALENSFVGSDSRTVLPVDRLLDD
jgi:hypothetical protein